MIRRPAAVCITAGVFVVAASVAVLRRNPDWHTADCGCMFSLGLRPRILACAGHVHAREYIAEQLSRGLR